MAKCTECEHYSGIIIACCWPYPKDSPFWADSQHRIADPNQLHDCKAFLQRQSRLKYTIEVKARIGPHRLFDIAEDLEIKERLEDFLRDLLESRDATINSDITVEDAE